MTTKTKAAPRINLTTKAILTMAGSTRAAEAVSGTLDQFQIARKEVEQEFILLTQAQEVDLVRVLDSSEFTKDVKAAAGQLLFRAHAPTALMLAVNESRRYGVDFDEAISAANAALWQVIGRWDASKGMSLSAFVRMALPVEFTRQRQLGEGTTQKEWKEIAVITAMNELEGGLHAPIHTGYAQVDGVDGHKTNTTAIFTGKGLNRPRVWDRAVTGYHTRELKAAKAELLELGIKLTSRRSLRAVFARPARPIRREDITPALVQAEMKRHRMVKGLPFSEKEWSLGQIELIMTNLKEIVSYDATLNEDSETTFADLLGFEPEWDREEEKVVLDRQEFTDAFKPKVAYKAINAESINVRPSRRRFEQFAKRAFALAFLVGTPQNWMLPQVAAIPEFSDVQLADASFITKKLKESGLWEIAMSIPVDRFLEAHQNGDSVAFAELVHAYGIRYKHAKEICKVIDLHFSEYGRDKATRLS